MPKSKSILFIYRHQFYCWQVALQQSLRPLQTDTRNVKNLLIKITNYFLPHYRIPKNKIARHDTGLFFINHC